MKKNILMTLSLLLMSSAAISYPVFVHRDAKITDLECLYDQHRNGEKTSASVHITLSSGRTSRFIVFDRADSNQVCKTLNKLKTDHTVFDFRRITYGFGNFIYDLKLPNGEIVFFSYSSHERSESCLKYQNVQTEVCEKY